ncbi:hypothetical protein Asp14428_69510 [Actinoplanes sp. NBRC 14428]|nr:hypothetical protein Asp14428_69510 [Actinoplanes sp. NBRC 14428]
MGAEPRGRDRRQRLAAVPQAAGHRRGSDDFTDSKTGYTIVEAASQDEADGIFAEHPHLRLFQGNWIEVLECPPMPGP